MLRDYITVTRALDPVALERARMAQVERGEVPTPEHPEHGLVYVALQELATRVAHHNTGKLLDDPAGREVMKRVAADENRHYLFYRGLADAAFEIDPSGMMLAVEHEVRTFEMPGTGHHRLRAPRQGDRPGRDLRLPRPLRADPAARSCSGTGTSRRAPV